MPEKTSDLAPTNPSVVTEPKISYPNEGIAAFSFECLPYIKAEDAKKDATVKKPKDMPQEAWNKQFDHGTLLRA
jgi:hypothetical protein